MKKVIFTQYPLAERTSCGLPISHDRWFRAQFRYFEENCKLRREKRIEDFVSNNNFTKVHILRDNPVLESIIQCPLGQADLLIITDQRFSRLSLTNIIKSLETYLKSIPTIYLCLNKHYLNYNDIGPLDQNLPNNYDAAITAWLQKNLLNTKVFNVSSNFVETGADFTWVIPPSEHIICKN
jgi:hypothetical protein